eukprot:3353922-Pleurochrysis_carterae.AAC.2
MWKPGTSLQRDLESSAGQHAFLAKDHATPTRTEDPKRPRPAAGDAWSAKWSKWDRWCQGRHWHTDCLKRVKSNASFRKSTSDASAKAALAALANKTALAQLFWWRRRNCGLLHVIYRYYTEQPLKGRTRSQLVVRSTQLSLARLSWRVLQI